MARIIKEVSCSVGQYTNAAGEQKQRYQRIGSIIETKIGPMLKLDVIPLKEGSWDGWAYLNDPKPKEGEPVREPVRQRSRSNEPPPYDDLESDPPF
jgi:hypothetical protein